MKKLFLISILFLILISSCQSQIANRETVGTETQIKDVPPTATSTITPKPPTETSVPPTETPFPSETATATMTATPVINFEISRIYGIENRGDYISVILEFPGIKTNYGVMLNNKEYNCKLVDDVPDRLFCTGPALILKSYTSIKYFTDDGTWQNPLYEGTVYVPEPYKTPYPPGDPSTWCPLRGTDVFCETEHRVENGEECWVMTCSDACGYFFSYHTCTENPNGNFLPP